MSDWDLISEDEKERRRQRFVKRMMADPAWYRRSLRNWNMRHPIKWLWPQFKAKALHHWRQLRQRTGK